MSVGLSKWLPNANIVSRKKIRPSLHGLAVEQVEQFTSILLAEVQKFVASDLVNNFIAKKNDVLTGVLRICNGTKSKTCCVWCLFLVESTCMELASREAH